MIQLAAIQMCSGGDVDTNLAIASSLLEKAARQGATLALLPENFALMPATHAERLKHAESDGEGVIQAMLAETSRRLGLWVVAGTIALRCPSVQRVRAACLVFNDRGIRVARYDKMHLFDADLGGGERYQESAVCEPGDAAVVVDAPFGRIGLSVCYDLRFPELFRRLVEGGATILTVPAAFTVPTGTAHWESLARARAIENTCYVVAAGQEGRHPDGRVTYGHSMIIDPWGRVVAAEAAGAAVVLAPCEQGYLEKVRTQLPSLRHRRF